MDFSQGLRDRINCVSKRGCLQMYYKGSSSQKFRKTPVSEFLCNKVTGVEPATLFIWKKRLQHKCLPVSFATFFRRPIFEENLQEDAFGNGFLNLQLC